MELANDETAALVVEATPKKTVPNTVINRKISATNGRKRKRGRSAAKQEGEEKQEEEEKKDGGDDTVRRSARRRNVE